MGKEDTEPRRLSTLIAHPSVWLVVPTTALLLGQAAVTAPWELPAQAGLLLVFPLLLMVRPQMRRWASLILGAAVLFSLGYIRHRQLLEPDFPAHHLRSVMNENALLYLEGRLIQEPEKLTSRNRWLVRSERLWHPTGAEEIIGDLLVSVRVARREWRYGDRVRFQLRPTVPRNSGNPGGFDYASYLARRGIHAVAYLDADEEVELVARDPGPVRGAIEDLRRNIRHYLEQNFSHDHGALMKALVIGDQGNLSKELRSDFTAAGITHVLSISGLHVAMLGLVVFVVFRFGCGFSSFLLLRCNLLKLATFLSFLAVVFYTALAGAMVPTVRSAIMIGVYEFAVLLDREEEVFLSLTLAVLLIALVWPGVVTDISFQLSFLAVLFIVWGMRRVYGWSPPRKREGLPQEQSWLKEKLRRGSLHFAVPLFATLGTGPLIAHYFGHLSLAGFVANPLLVPLVGFVVVPLGLMIGFLSATIPEIAWPLVWLADQCLSVTLWLVGWFARLPLANVFVPAPNLLEVTALYFLIALFVTFMWNRYTIIAVAAVTTALAVDGLYWWAERWHRKELRVTHLNVGQGDAAVVELPGSKVMVIDAGGSAMGEFDTGEGIVAPFLRSRKILKADYLIVSHPRIDHYGGMRALVSEFSPGEFWSGPGRGRTGRFEDLEDAVGKNKIKRIGLNSGEPCRMIEGVRFCILYPGPDRTDDVSVVLRLDFGAVRYLFAGDIDKRDEKLLLQHSEALRSTIIKVPRHGSAMANTAEFIDSVKPKLAIISAGGGSALRRPRDEVVERYRNVGAEILRTDEDGAIIVRTDGYALRYEGYKNKKTGKLAY